MTGPEGVERRRQSGPREPALVQDLTHLREYVQHRLDEGQAAMDGLRASVDSTIADMKLVKEDTAVIRDAVVTWRVGRNILSTLGAAGVWFVGVFGTVVLVVQGMRGKLW